MPFFRKKKTCYSQSRKLLSETKPCSKRDTRSINLSFLNKKLIIDVTNSSFSTLVKKEKENIMID